MKGRETSAHGALFVLVAFTVFVAVVTIRSQSGASGGHRVTVIAPSASWILPGLEVRSAGSVIGTVAAAAPTRAGTARVTLQITDNQMWPIPVGTRATFRWGGTIAFTNRYVELDLPPNAGAHGTLPNGGVIQGRDIVPAVELDQVLGTFDTATRHRLAPLLDRSGTALQAAVPGLRGTLQAAPATLDQARTVLSDAGQEPEALGRLVTSLDGVVHAADAANPGVGTLLSNAAVTLNGIATQSDAMQRVIGELPGALDTARVTLRHASRTLVPANRLLQRLAPGITEVRALAPPLWGLLLNLLDVGPSAYSTLASLGRAVPDLNPLLSQATTTMPVLDRIGKLGTTEVACVRPYAPDIAGFLSTWTGFESYSDNTDKYIRANAGVFPFPENDMPTSSAQALKLFPTQGLRYTFPTPPGEVAGQPWFIPSCGVGPSSLDASKDPEAP